VFSKNITCDAILLSNNSSAIFLQSSKYLIGVAENPKTFALELLRNKKCLFLTSQKPIIDQIIRHIESCGLTLNDFPYLKFDLYQNITEQIATTYSTDCIVLDEFHRCGAPKWGKVCLII